ncbi:MAG: peptidyl-alpha-hydroxyglycine alpha-amidating lyase family protein [Candidatus Latescibacterota bacterium]|nr:peptidyl-alpha-hydroxyglycine alpha-amidating lyase family protein [Candidatus Latescibacterota bacterium]
MIVGSGEFTYEFAQGWGELPFPVKLGWCAAVACDSRDRVYVYSRTPSTPIVVFEPNGTYVGSWGQLLLEDGHGVFIENDDRVWCVERETHCVRKLTAEGDLLMTIGNPHTPGAEGEPFNLPTDIGFDSKGFIYITDGYGNAVVHKYTPDGERVLAFGSPGNGRGQFDLPHCVRVDPNDRLLVCDRSNNRIQLFNSDGEYLEDWGHFNHPDTIHIDSEGIVYVAELDQRVSILNLGGELLARWGKGKRTDAPGEFRGCPHGIWTDSKGDLYICEVQTNGRYQKFIRQR